MRRLCASAAVLGAIVVAVTSVAGAAAARDVSLSVEIALRTGVGVAGGAVTSDSGAVRCPSRCDASIVSGSRVRLFARAQRGYRFFGWSPAALCEEHPKRTSTCTFVPRTRQFVIAYFEPVRIPVDVFAAGDGTITSSPPGIRCPGGTNLSAAPICVGDFSPGTRVVLTATPDSGARFVRWSLAECPDPRPVCSLKVRGETWVTGIFDPVHLFVQRLGFSGRILSTPPGIDCGGECSEQEAAFHPGANVTLRAIADGGHPFTGWGDPCGGPSPTCKFALYGTQSVSAAFGTPPTADPPLTALSADRREVGLTVTRTGRGKGVVRTTGPRGVLKGISCGDRCRLFGYERGEQIVVRASASHGSRFVRFRHFCGRRPVCRVHAGGVTSMRAVFNRRHG